MESIAVGIFSFIGGMVVTAFMYTAKYDSRLSRIETKLNALIENKSQPCPFHTRVESDIAVLKSQLKA